MQTGPSPENIKKPLPARESPATLASAKKATHKYKMHWHVFFIHYPISAFFGSFGFMLLHIITGNSCYEVSAYVALMAGATVMIPTTFTGWKTWKSQYKGAMTKIFFRKIWISCAMIVVSVWLVVYRSIFSEHVDIILNAWHFIYFAGVILLFLGALAEGFFGGRLNHR